MKHLLILLFGLILVLNQAFGHEGMWLPLLLEQLNEKDMIDKGMKLTAKDLYDINNSSLKDAIVHFDGGCTAEVVSDKGLILTNHHCGYDEIQKHSSVEHDYLTDGFWAKSVKDELKNPGLTATFIVRMEDVTNKVLEGIEDVRDDDRKKYITEKIEKIIEEATSETHYGAKIKPFFYGNQYYMFITETFKDVRLVGAPPSSIGKFGGDTDNWMWPRHTGDFSVFRIYADKDNKPAEYAWDNVPYKPKHHFPISLKGINKGDFTFVYGFPGRTEEYLTSHKVDYIQNVRNPARIKYRRKILDILEKTMAKSNALRIKYAVKHARISNYYKKWIGESNGLKRFDVYNKKVLYEQQFEKLIQESVTHQKQHGNMMSDFKQRYQEAQGLQFSKDYYSEMIYYGADLINFLRRFRKPVLKVASYAKRTDGLDDQIKEIRKKMAELFRNFDLETDKKLFAASLKMYYEANKGKAALPSIYDLINGKYKGNYEKFTDYVYDKTIFTNKALINEFLNDFSPKSVAKVQKDPAYLVMDSFLEHYHKIITPNLGKLNTSIDHLYRDYIKLQQELVKDKTFYPDANSTLRITYGEIGGYVPKDGVRYGYYTTLEGVMEKYDPEHKDFKLPKKLIELYDEKDYGQYKTGDDLLVCFTASNHTTGGNSGSPLLNAEGQLIGINFDRTWESTMSDIYYNPQICRNIVVDIRYVLFIIDKFAGANRLVDEMDIVTKESELNDIIIALTQRIKADSANSEIYNSRGLAKFELRDFTGALNDFEKCIAMAPNTAKYHYNKGSTLVNFKRIEDANISFSQAIDLNKEYTEAYYNRGKTFTDLKKFKEAITDFDFVIQENPKHARAYNNRGVAKSILLGDGKGCADIEYAMKLGSTRAAKTFKKYCE